MDWSALTPSRWIDGVRHSLQRKQLRDAHYAFLFDEAPADEYVSLDCETTGLNTRTDHIISVGAVRIKNNRILASQRLELLIQPPSDVPAESIRVHRLRHADVAGGMPVEAAMEQLLHFIGSRPLVGYFLEFDVAMLNRVLKPMLGIKLPQPQIEVSALYYDYQFKRLPPYQQHDNAGIDLKFDTMMQALDLPVREAHDALNDAVMAALAFIKLRELES